MSRQTTFTTDIRTRVFLSWKACIHTNLSAMTGPSKDCRIYCHIYGKDPCPGMLFRPSDSILFANSGQHF